ncbi:hypothetical protein E3U43_015223 [Larimichthys crocea]|uniref:Uncharacterized protein n=1 Tax=Larimichthys crocea TaxID=215358 RepID=A0ACD3RPJ8_LARCR|nr:hypothetical protein E3U43_015223 [Larimichthys crocea]
MEAQKPRNAHRNHTEPSQGFNTEHEWSEDESNGTYFSSSRQQSRANKSRDRDFFDSSSRVSPEGGKSPTMKNVSSEEEELMYLEFISAGKMRHLLEVLRKDFEETPNTFTCSTEFEKKENGLLDTFLPNLEAGEKQVKTKENNDLSLYASLIKDCDSLGYADPLMVSTPLCSPERFDSPTQTTEKYGEDDNLEKGISSPGLSEHVSNNAGISEEDFDQNQIGTTATNEVSNENHENASLSSDKGFHQELEQAEEAKHARNLSELSDREEAWRSATLVPIHKQTADKREELCASDEKSLNPFDLEDENPSADRILVCCWTTLSCTWLANDLTADDELHDSEHSHTNNEENHFSGLSEEEEV